jgi:hypothetical protein
MHHQGPAYEKGAVAACRRAQGQALLAQGAGLGRIGEGGVGQGRRGGARWRHGCPGQRDSSPAHSTNAGSCRARRSWQRLFSYHHANAPIPSSCIIESQRQCSHTTNARKALPRYSWCWKWATRPPSRRETSGVEWGSLRGKNVYRPSPPPFL